jgi:hypothetical protein
MFVVLGTLCGLVYGDVVKGVFLELKLALAQCEEFAQTLLLYQ